MKETLVLFDFDGTLARGDSMLAFARFYCGNARFLLGLFYLLPMLLAYKAGWIPNWRAKEYFLTYFFGNEPLPRFQQGCERFAKEKLPGMLRPKGLGCLKKHLASGSPAVVVSSSAEDWLSPWCRQQHIPLIGSRLETRDGQITGKLDGPNCYGDEKARRIRELFNLDDFSEIIAYGDSKGDFAMFGLATRHYYKPFRK
ncbi:MAG: HAD-IB family hydrolase [Phaeodactylibacter sp.]|nr:HAD-IB family hydrolase [Phaeodactylibacter sp.]MCB9274530.1 HAD-IB family hydrolase [Lewinellaceae bacterium]